MSQTCPKGGRHVAWVCLRSRTTFWVTKGKQTMNQNKKLSAVTRVSQSAVFAAQRSAIEAIEGALLPGPVLDVETHRTYSDLVRRNPDRFVEAVAALAEEQEGALGGVAIDSREARESIAYAAACRPFALALRKLAQRIEHTALRRRAKASQEAMAAVASLEGMSRAPDGDALRDTVKALRSQSRRPARPRPAKKSDAATPGAPVAPA